MDHAELDPSAQRRDRTLAIAAIDMPGPLPDHGHVGTIAAEFFLSQDLPS
jgi:hypothetical protein